MGTSRRRFLHDSAAAMGALALPTLGCAGAREEPAAPKQPGAGPARRAREPAYLRLAREGRLPQIEKELWAILGECRLCPRACAANRIGGERGVCSSTARLKIASYGPHFGEERPLVGRGGSGTIFFSNCNLLCCFCQNWEINHRGDGQYATHAELADMMLDLQRRGCHNINLVTPTHVVPHIVKALGLAVDRGFTLPLVYNTGGYDNLDVIKALDGLVDIYLPDFKYQDGTLAARYSSGAADYPDVAAAAIREMHRQVGVLAIDGRGIAERGLIIRHLVMPHNIAGTDRFVRWVAGELTKDTYVNIMRQYRPEHRASDYPELARRISLHEWEQALAWARQAGLTNLDT
ncbi:MAG: radical SAM protein [Acidobacteriota bacterium]